MTKYSFSSVQSLFFPRILRTHWYESLKLKQIMPGVIENETDNTKLKYHLEYGHKLPNQFE